MSNHKTNQAIELHHSQVNAGKARKKARAEHRRHVFEFNRANIKVRVEADRQYLAACVLVFLIGLIFVIYGVVYIIGAILYG